MIEVIQIARLLVAVVCLGAAVVALTHWAVKAKKLSPFGGFARAIRKVSDPIIKPLERRIVQSGGNPVNAPWWLFWIVVIGGLVFLSLLQWSLGSLVSLGYAAQAGPRGVLRFLVDGLFGLLIACVLIRVIASWLGISSYAWWMRPIVFLTDWLLEPLRRLIPPLGMFDISPLVAWLLLILARSLVLGLL
jgi:YggT family protein